MDRAIQFNRHRAAMAVVELLPDQQDQLDIVMSWLVFHQPFFAHLIMAEIPIVPTLDVPVAATDSFNIFVNPTTFFVYTTPEQAFILAHEVLHVVFNDPTLLAKWVDKGSVRVGNTDWPCEPDKINIAMDYVINAQLILGKVGRFNSQWLYDAGYSKEGKEAMVNVYEQVLKNARPPNPNQQFDFVMVPPDQKPDGTKQEPRDELIWKQACAAAAQAADMQGKLPANFKQLINEILEPKVKWQDHLRATIMRINGSDGLDWSQADRRMLARDAVGHERIFFGRPMGFGCGTVVVGADSSGSMVDMIDEIMREVRGIMEDLNPREIVLIWCDSKIQRVDTLEEAADLETVRAKGAPGGGGTSFVPVFKEVEKLGLDPDMLIYLTDMYGTFPQHEPNYPVVWGSISPVKDAPFGEVVTID